MKPTSERIAHLVDDGTERKQVQEALRESEALFRVIFDQSAQLMGVMKPDGTLLKINRTAARFIDVEESEVIGKLFWDTPWWSHSEEQRERLRKAVTAAAEGEFVRFEASHPTPEGNVVWVDFSLKPVRDDEGRIIYLLPEGRDMTQQKQTTEQIEILNTELAHRNAELEAANKELEAFSYSVSHDLRAPLSVIMGYCQLLQELCGDSMRGQCRSFLPQITAGASRMTGLIDALLQFSRVTRGDLHREKVCLSALAHELIGELRHHAPERRVTLRVAEGVEADGDASLLRVALGNLVGNAWKYTSRQDEAIIEFGVATIREVTAYFVRDNGTGFDMADAEKLFMPFQRLADNAGIAGHGIGLATVDRIIKRHGGRVWAEGEPGKGATFYFTLPADGA